MAPLEQQRSHRVADPADQPREMSGLAWGALVSLGLLGLLGLVRIFSALGLHSAAGGGANLSSEYDGYANWTGIYGLVGLVAGGVFIAWFYRGYRNLRRLGVQNMRYGPGWAIGAWFVPILNLFRPKQIANDIWRGSERGVEVSTQWSQVEVPDLVHWWWGLFLAQGILSWIGERIAAAGDGKVTSVAVTPSTLESGLSQIRSGTMIDILGAITGIAAVIVAIMVVSRVTRRLDLVREDALAAGAVAAPAPVPTGLAPQTMSAPSWPSAPASIPPPAPPAAPFAVAAAPPAGEGRVQCPQCAEWILPQAKLCRFCGQRLGPAQQ